MDENNIHVNFGQVPPKAKQVFWGTRKGKIAIVAIALVSILIVSQFIFNAPVSTAVQEPWYYTMGFSQELKASGDGNPVYPNMNHVVFPYSIIACQEDNTVETIFESIYADAGDFLIVTEDANGEDGWIHYYSSQTNNELTNIFYYKTYWVDVTNTCTLSLSCLD